MTKEILIASPEAGKALTAEGQTESIYQFLEERNQTLQSGDLKIDGLDTITPWAGSILSTLFAPENEREIPKKERFKSLLKPARIALATLLLATVTELSWPVVVKAWDSQMDQVVAAEHNQDGGITHIIQKGETLYSLAKRYNTTFEAIMAANPAIKSADLIYIGQELIIPSYGGEVVPRRQGVESESSVPSNASNRDWPIEVGCVKLKENPTQYAIDIAFINAILEENNSCGGHVGVYIVDGNVSADATAEVTRKWPRWWYELWVGESFTLKLGTPSSSLPEEEQAAQLPKYQKGAWEELKHIRQWEVEGAPVEVPFGDLGEPWETEARNFANQHWQDGDIIMSLKVPPTNDVATPTPQSSRSEARPILVEETQVTEEGSSPSCLVRNQGGGSAMIWSRTGGNTPEGIPIMQATDVVRKDCFWQYTGNVLFPGFDGEDNVPFYEVISETGDVRYTEVPLP